MSRPVEIAQLKDMLEDRIDSLVLQLLPNGDRHGHEWVEARTAAGGLGDSFKVHLAQPRRGVWMHGAANRSGDVIDLIAYVHGSNKGEAIRWARVWLGIDNGSELMTRGTDRRLEEAAARKAQQARATADDVAKKARAARFIWLGAEPKLAGTPVDLYLQGRGIDLRRLGRQPRALRYHPALEYKQPVGPVSSSGAVDRANGPTPPGSSSAAVAQQKWEVLGTWPALVAQINGEIVDRDGVVITGQVAVHRTWLEQVDRRWIKCRQVPDAKKTLGRFRGGWIPIWRGASGVPLASAPDGDEVAITEGIEDALTVAIAAPHLRVLCAVSLANMGAMVLPGQIRTVTVVADNDGANQAAAGGLERAVSNFMSQGKRVKVARPPEGAKDVNDLLQGKVETNKGRVA